MNAKQFVALALVLVFAAQIPTWATGYRFQGERNVQTVVNQHAVQINNLRSEIVELAAKLDDQTGANDHEEKIESLQSAIVELAAKLDADGTAGTDYESALSSGAGVTSTTGASTFFATDFETGLAAGTSAVTSTATAHTLTRGN